MKDRDLPENIGDIGNPEMDTTWLINMITKLFPNAFSGGITEEQEVAFRQFFDSPETRQLMLDSMIEDNDVVAQLS
jgi:hypothetical protein